jgi:hypothetical protein
LAEADRESLRLSRVFADAPVQHKRGELPHALEVRVRVDPLHIGLPDFIGLAVDDEDSSGRNLLDVVVKGRTDS